MSRFPRERAAYAVVLALSFANNFSCTSQSGGAAAQPKVLPACEQAATQPCHAEVPISPPVVVGPGRIRVLSRKGFGQVRRGVAPLRTPPEQRFVLVDITLEGSEVLVEDQCPEHSLPIGFANAGPGFGAILCAPPGDSVVDIGFAHAKGARVEWRFRERLVHRQKYRGAAASHYLAALDGKMALVINPIGSKGVPEPPWGVHMVPGPPGYSPLCSEEESWCPEKIVALVVAGGALHLFMTTDATSYEEFIVTPDGKVSVKDPLKSAHLSAGILNQACVSQGKDGSATLVLPVEATSDWQAARVATLRFQDATLPLGPDVYPTELAFCAPARFEDTSNVSWLQRTDVRATLGPASLVVYTLLPTHVFSPDGVPTRTHPGSFRVFRRATSDE